MSDSEVGQDIIRTERHAEMTRGLRPVRTSEQARELSRIRWDRVSAEARRGMIDAGKQLPGVGGSSPAVVRYLAEQHTLNAADPSAPGSVQSFREVMRIAYPAPDRQAPAATVPAGGAQLNLSPEMVRELIGELRARRAG